MNSKIKNKKNYLLLAIFVLVLIVSLGFGKNTKAQSTGTPGNTQTPASWTDTPKDANGNPISQGSGLRGDAGLPAESGNGEDELCPGMSFWSPVTSILNCIFLVIAKVLLTIVKAIFVLFINIIDSKNITNVVGNPVIYQIWTMVRDVLNVAFILAILFSAFSTIFQIQKYSYKSLLLTIIIMALLVNFSFPIARVIIDISNVIMYSFVQGFGITSGTGGFMQQILTKSGFDTLVSEVVKVGVASASTIYLITLVVFLFIFAMTLLILAILFVIRLTALAILVIFSPIAFVGPILPFLSKYSGDWWDNLFKYSFFGPIMVFMLYVSLKMMTAISSMQGTMSSTAVKQGDTPGLVASIAFFAIPVVILWFGMAVAQKMSIAGASTVTGAASKFAMGAGKKFSGYNAVKRQYDSFAAQRKKREDEKAKTRMGVKVGKWTNKAQDTVIGGLPIVGKAAKKRAEDMGKAERRENVANGSKAVGEAGTNMGDMAKEARKAFDAAGNVVKADKAQAANAKAFTDKSADDRKTYVEATLQAATGPNGAGTDLANILANVAPGSQLAISIANIQNNANYNQDDLRRVSSHISNQMEKVMQKYVNG